ncbi:MAG: hypothetical protein MUD02_09035 [Bacteroidales bacterium]|jgi:hypothetical protein|nr:hypothetical protein [Bacteroidales bacterium]
MMLRKLIPVLVMVLSLPGCSKDELRTSGIDTIDNRLFGSGPYYAMGFQFSSGAAVSTLDDPGPDIVLYMNADNPALPRLTFQASNFQPSFALAGTYASEAEAIAAFNGLTDVGTYSWDEIAEPIVPNQVWVYRSSRELYTKIRTVSTVSEMRPDIPFRYGECTFEWVHQPDGTPTFPAQ